MATPFDAIRSALQGHDVQVREFVSSPGRDQLMVLFGRAAAGDGGLDAYRHAVVVEYSKGQWLVGPPSGDRSFVAKSCSSEGAALAATLDAMKCVA